jgi:hypothetical protein
MPENKLLVAVDMKGYSRGHGRPDHLYREIGGLTFHDPAPSTFERVHVTSKTYSGYVWIHVDPPAAGGQAAAPPAPRLSAPGPSPSAAPSVRRRPAPEPQAPTSGIALHGSVHADRDVNVAERDLVTNHAPRPWPDAEDGDEPDAPADHEVWR